jgi:NhaP-type Na+/H+ and K+/H+ antiporter
VVLAVTCFTVAQLLGGSGFIAAFVGGLLFGGITKQHKHGFLLAAEGTGDTLALITWVTFGAAMVGQVIGSLQLERGVLRPLEPHHSAHVAGISGTGRHGPAQR